MVLLGIVNLCRLMRYLTESGPDGHWKLDSDVANPIRAIHQALHEMVRERIGQRPNRTRQS